MLFSTYWNPPSVRQSVSPVFLYAGNIEKCPFTYSYRYYPLFLASPDGWAVWSAVVFTRWWLLVDHCVLRNWDRILVRAVKGLISRAGMVSICPLLWQRDVKLQQTKPKLSSIPFFWFFISIGGGGGGFLLLKLFAGDLGRPSCLVFHIVAHVWKIGGYLFPMLYICLALWWGLITALHIFFIFWI